MFKSGFNSSFTVGFQMRGKTRIVTGVTSIVPNLNGILMFTKDGENHFIESCELTDGQLKGMFIEYSNSEDIAQYAAQPDVYDFHDHGVEPDWL